MFKNIFVAVKMFIVFQKIILLFLIPMLRYWNEIKEIPDTQ